MTASPKLTPPTEEEYNEFYHRYICLAQVEDFFHVFESQPQALRETLGDLPAEEVAKLHGSYTWSLKQVVGHLIDCERIFSTRLLRIAVGDTTPLPGMNQDIYVSSLDYDSTSMQALLDEFSHLRQANVLLAKRLNTENLGCWGTASDYPVTAKANLFILVGHVEYHFAIIRQRLGHSD